MKSFRSYALIISALLLIVTTNSKGQQPSYNLPTDPSTLINIPPSPSAGELGKFGDFPVSLATGKPDIAIPLYTLTSGKLSAPIGLRYQADGIKVNDKAPWTGLGWVLNAGGVVTRNVLGIADELPKGYLNQGIPNATALVPADNHPYVIDVTRGKHDNQADIFHFSFNGTGGKFMFQQDGSVQIIPFNPDIKITYNITQGSISDFTIVDQMGTTYIFDKTEKTNATNYIPEAGTPTTAWYLSEMIGANGIDRIEFNYHNLGNKFFDIPDIQTHYIKFTDPINPNSYTTEIQKAYDKGDYTVQNMRRISSIESDFGRVVFNHSTGNRLDDPNDNDVRLDNIEIYDISGTKIKKYDLNYDHFQSAGFSYLKLEYTYRLKLESIQETAYLNNTSTSKPKFEFEYLDNSSQKLPPRHTSAQDYWGYFNGNNSANLIPRKDYVLQNGNIIQLGSADRTPNANKMVAGSLKSIVYPTGGKTVFEFEPHEAKLDYIEYAESPRIEQVHVVHIANQPAPGVYEHTKTFSVGNLIGANSVRSTVNYGVTTDAGREVPTHYYTTVRMKDLTTGNIIIEQVNDTLPGNQAVWLQANHDYEIYARCIPANQNMQNPNATAALSVFWKEQNPNQVIKNEIIGGLRIKNISNYDSDHTTLLATKSFEYHNPSDASFSSGFFNQNYRPDPNSFYRQRSIRREHYPSGCLSCRIQEDLIVSMTAKPTSASGFLSNPVTYQYVTVYDSIKDGSTYPNGRTVSEFLVEKDYWYPNYGGIGEYNSDRSYKRGLLKNEKIFDKDNNLITETVNVHEFVDMQNDITGIKIGGLYDIHWNDIIKQEFDDHCLCPLVMSNGQSGCLFIACNPPVGQVINARYQFKYNFTDPVVWVRLKSKLTTTDGISQIQEYAYSNDALHSQPTETSTLNSDGSKIIAKTKFVRDFDIQNSFGTSQDWRTKSLFELDAKNINHPIEITTYLQKANQNSAKMVSSVLNLYKTLGNLPVPLLHQVWQTESTNTVSNFQESYVNSNDAFVRASQYKYQGVTQPIYTIQSYNSRSQITAFNKTYGTTTSVSYGENEYLPTAKCTNANYAEIGFTSFEEVDNSWTYSQSCRSNGAAKVGHKKLRISTSCSTISKALPSGSYVVGFWAKASNSNAKINVSGSSGLAKTVNLSTDWKYFEVELNSTSSVSITNNGTGLKYLDELRVHPKDAEMETYTYRNQDLMLVGMGDVNGRTSTFEYDDFQRLKVSRDFEGNILEANEYYYAANASEKNWVKTYNARIPGIQSIADFGNLSKSEKDANIKFLDGLGRVVQAIGLAQSPAGMDLVQIHEYDIYGSEIKRYLPFTKSNNNGQFVNNAKTFQNLFYGNLINAYGYVEVEKTKAPIDRVVKQSAPGSTWKLGSGHEVQMQYRSNQLNEVRLFNAQGNSSGYYAPSELIVIATIDENGGTRIEYSDKLGELIMTDDNGNKTYKVRDDFGRLIYQVPPEAFNKMMTTGIYSCGYHSATHNNVYKYTYDSRGRKTSRRIPGKHTEYYYYDRLDRLVMTKDGKNNRVITKYDILNRPIIIGMYTGSGVPSVSDGLYESETPGAFGYTLNQSFPSTNVDVLSINYYDHHDFDRNGTLSTNELAAQDPAGNYTESPDSYNRGRVTGTKVAYFAPGKLIVDGYITTKNYYDTRNRIIQSRVINHTNEEEITFSEFNFRDLLLRTKHLHRASLTTTHATVVEREFTYDHFGRMLKAYHQVNNGDKELIYENKFDEKDRLKLKKLGATNAQESEFLQTVNYSYNIRGWITGINSVGSCGVISGKDEIGIGKVRSVKNNDELDSETLFTNDDLFGMQIRYNSPTNIANIPGAITPQFNGNISSVTWQSGCGNTVNYYGFNYDDRNQLLDAYYGQGTTKANLTYTSGYDMHATYDLNGNILTLRRNENGSLIDNLNYTYDEANHLTNLEELSDLSNGFKSLNGTASFSYDNNGNMERDNHRELDIHYNFLNLPEVIGFDNEDSLIFRYDANGDKLAKHAKASGQSNWNIKTYIGSFEYENDNLIATYHEEGRVTANGNGFQYEYSIKDHLGNVRLNFSDLNGDGEIKSDDGEVLQESHYYPFGLKMNGAWNQVNGVENHYQFNGKEFNNDFGLDLSDYGARWYYPAIGRWISIDPVAESEEYISLTPYHFVRNSPTNLFDLNGMYDNVWHFNVVTGEVTLVSSTEGGDSQTIKYVDEDGKILKSHTFEGNKTIYIGPVAVDSYDGGWEWRAATADLWEDVPAGYVGHYTAWDLDERRRARLSKDPKGQEKYKQIVAQEQAGLDRRDMIWNHKDRADMIYEIYGSTSGFVVAHYYMMLEEMLPSGPLGKHFRSLKKLQSWNKAKGVVSGKIRIHNMKRLKMAVSRAKSSRIGSPPTQKMQPSAPQVKSSPAGPQLKGLPAPKNPWNRFLKANAGKYKGKGWQSRAASDYRGN